MLNQSLALVGGSWWQADSEWIVKASRMKLGRTTNHLITDTHAPALSHFAAPREWNSNGLNWSWQHRSWLTVSSIKVITAYINTTSKLSLVWKKLLHILFLSIWSLWNYVGKIHRTNKIMQSTSYNVYRLLYIKNSRSWSFGKLLERICTFVHLILLSLTLLIPRGYYLSCLVEEYTLGVLEVVGSIPGPVIAKTLKMILGAFMLSDQH